MIEFGERGVQIGQLRFLRGRILGRAALQKRTYLAVGMAQLGEQPPQRVAKVGQQAAAAAGGRADDIDARRGVAERRPVRLTA